MQIFIIDPRTFLKLNFNINLTHIVLVNNNIELYGNLCLHLS